MLEVLGVFAFLDTPSLRFPEVTVVFDVAVFVTEGLLADGGALSGSRSRERLVVILELLAFVVTLGEASRATFASSLKDTDRRDALFSLVRKALLIGGFMVDEGNIGVIDCLFRRSGRVIGVLDFKFPLSIVLCGFFPAPCAEWSSKSYFPTPTPGVLDLRWASLTAGSLLLTA